jgi:hypothetical protein
MKDEGTTSKAPLTEAFGQWKNLRVVLICLFGAAMGQAVVWYTGQFYAMFYLEKILVEGASANILIAIALALGTPLFVFFGWLGQDRAQIHPAGRLRAGRAHLSARLPSSGPRHQSGAGRRVPAIAGSGDG